MEVIKQKGKYEELTKGLGITGLVVGIVALLVSLIPCIGQFAFIFGVIGALISVSALATALKHDYEKGIIIGGLICSLLGTTIAYSQYRAILGLSEKLIEETKTTINQVEDELEENEELQEELKELEEAFKKDVEDAEKEAQQQKDSVK